MTSRGWVLFFSVATGCASTPLVHVDLANRGPECVSRVRIFDGVADQLTEPMNVVFAGGRIESVVPADGTVGPGCVDGAGKTLMPGLIDSHAHAGLATGLPPWKLGLPNLPGHMQSFLYSGVTSVLIAATSSGLPDLADDIRAGRAVGPSVFRASRIFTAENGHPVPMYKAVLFWPLTTLFIRPGVTEVASDADVGRAVDTELAERPDFLKVVYDDIPPGTPHLTREALRRIVTLGRAGGTRTIVHVGSAKEAVDAAQAGAALLMHTPWEDELSDADVAAIAATGVAVVTTRRIYSAIGQVLGDRYQLHPLERASCSAGDAESFNHRPNGFTFGAFDASYEAALPGYDAHLGANVKKLADAKVTLLVGTDAGLPGIFQGASIHREMQALVEAGLSNADVLRAATSVPAHLLDPSRVFGVIKAGAVADALLIDGDPLEDISATERIVSLWKGGLRVQRQPVP